MLSYKSTYIIALKKETQEEVARYLVTGHGLFTVADRNCDAETCGTSEGAELPVRPARRHRQDINAPPCISCCWTLTCLKTRRQVKQRDKIHALEFSKLVTFTDVAGYRNVSCPGRS